MTDENRSGGARGWEAPRWLRTGLLVLLGVAVGLALVLAFRPQPVAVELATVDRGPVEVAVEEDGRTRVRDRHAAVAPVAGTLQRIGWEAGDPVEVGSVLARIAGPEAAVPDPRTEAQLRARLEATRAEAARARATAEAAEATLVEAEEAVRRQEVLLETGGSSRSALDRARAQLRAREAEVRSAWFAVEAAEGQVEDVRLALQDPGVAEGEPVVVRSPVTGTVLRVHRQSAGAVSPGEPLVDVGDPGALEVVVDLLSADAVRVPVGAEAVLTQWGGEDELLARVRRVEPSGFTQVSALGVEEQRVNVILDPIGSGESESASGDAWRRVGDGFRVEARIVVDRVDDVVRVPAGALFRRGDGWAVFRAVDGRIEEVIVEVGRRSPAGAEVRSGLAPGDRAVIYPGDRVEDGVRYRER